MVNFPVYIQYSNSPNLKSLVNLTANSLLFTEDISANYLSILNANTNGLDNWGIILNQSRVVSYGAVYPKVWGFFNGVPVTDTTSYPQNFYNANFYNPTYDVTISLTDTSYRALLLLLYRKYTSNLSLADLNSIIQQYATITGASGVPNVISTYNMQITYQFNYTPLPYELKLFYDTDLLPVPMGVKLNLTF
jgi:hypothetical protein